MSTFLSVWDAIEDDPAQAQVMKIKSELMQRICDRIGMAGWGRVEAARHCGITMPRLDELTGGKVDLFTLEELVRIGTNLGLRLRIGVV